MRIKKMENYGVTATGKRRVLVKIVTPTRVRHSIYGKRRLFWKREGVGSLFCVSLGKSYDTDDVEYRLYGSYLGTVGLKG